MRILLDRHVGFIGNALARALRLAGHQCLAPGEPDLASPDALILLNWGSVPSSTAKSPELELQRSLAPFLAALPRLLAHAPQQILLISSAGALYAPSPEHVTEQSALVPTSMYGAGKASAEMFTRLSAQLQGCPLRILRPSNVYGPGQAIRAGFGVIPGIYAAVQEQVPLTLWPNSLSRRDYLYIDDFCSALLALLNTKPAQTHAIYNIASGAHANVPELIAHAEHLLQKPCPVQRMPAAEHANPRTLDVLPDASALRAHCGWTPQWDLPAGLAASFAALGQR
jgi:UDP-glucose 4-epimerase